MPAYPTEDNLKLRRISWVWLLVLFPRKAISLGLEITMFHLWLLLPIIRRSKRLSRGGIEMEKSFFIYRNLIEWFFIVIFFCYIYATTGVERSHLPKIFRRKDPSQTLRRVQRTHAVQFNSHAAGSENLLREIIRRETVQTLHEGVWR